MHYVTKLKKDYENLNKAHKVLWENYDRAVEKGKRLSEDKRKLSWGWLVSLVVVAILMYVTRG